MTRLQAWRDHASCRKQIVALKKRLARVERREVALLHRLGRMRKTVETLERSR